MFSLKIEKFKFSFFATIDKFKLVLLFYYLVSIQTSECFNYVYPLRSNASDFHRRNIGYIAPANFQYTRNDLLMITRFLNFLKDLNGDWSGHGLQRFVRLNSECSQSYVSLRNFRIKADVPVDEVFKDPYTLIETLIYRKFTMLKSKQLNKFICFHHSGIFVLKNLNELDKFCVFHHRIRVGNLHQYSLGSNNHVYLSFNKFGRLINPLINKNINQNECKNNQSSIFYVHTKFTDVFPETNYFPTVNKIYKLFHTTLRPIASIKTTIPITKKYFRRRFYKRPFRKLKQQINRRYRKKN